MQVKKTPMALLSLALMFVITNASAQFLRKEKPYSDHYNGKTFFNYWDMDKNAWYNYWLMYFYTSFKEWNTVQLSSLSNPQVSPGPQQVFFHLVGHSTFYMMVEGLSLLTDPIFSEKIGPYPYVLSIKRKTPASFQPEQMPSLDVVLITNNKYDHVDIPSLQKIDKLFSPIFVVPLGVGVLLKNKKIKNIIELDWYEKTTIKGTQIQLLPAQNSAGRTINDRNKSLWGGYSLVTPQLKSLLYMGETGASETVVAEIKKQFAGLDICFLPIGAFEPNWHMKYYNMKPHEALEMAQKIKCKALVGHRFGTFQIGSERYEEAADEMQKAITHQNVEFPVVYPVIGKNYFYPDQL